MSFSIQSIRQLMGAAVLDLPGAALRLRRPGDWVHIRNRSDHTEASTNPSGLRCLSDVTSSLHVCDMFPGFGNALLRTVCRDWTFQISERVHFSDNPDISFLIPHRGTDRESQLQTVIRSIASLPAAVECIVIEQDTEKRLGPLPGNTRYLHVPHAQQPELWHKCLAYNAGAEMARGRILVCHDGDVLVPSEYSRELTELLDQRKHDVAWPQRFLFYLNQQTTLQIMQKQNLAPLISAVPEQLKQNWVGGTLAITRNAFRKVGGFDTRFTGWTGEDREFYDRCQILNGWFFGYIPFIHLWHPHQTGRVDPTQRECNNEFVRAIMSIPREERVRRLVSLTGQIS